MFANVATVYGAADGDAELLYLVAKGNRSNIEQVATWRGQACVEGKNESGEGTKSSPSTRRGVAFVYSRDLDAKRWAVQGMGVAAMNGVGERPTTYVEGRRSAILKGGVLYELGPYTGAADELRILRIRGPGQYRLLHGGYDFDPLYYLTNRGEDLHDRMMFYFEHAKDPKMTGSVRREGNLVTWERTLGDWVASYTFDLSEGCNLVCYRLTTPKGTELWQGEYEMSGGAYVPKCVTMRHEEIDASGRRASQQVVRFEGNVVNQPIAASEFELAQLGLREGDRVQDDRVGIEYEYHVPSVAEVHDEVLLDAPGTATAHLPTVEPTPGGPPVAAQAHEFKGEGGVLVAGVMPDSPADRAGLQTGDIITEFNRQPVRDGNELRRLVAAARPGSTASVRIWREGVQKEFSVELGRLE